MKIIALLPLVVAAVAISLWSILWVSLPLGIVISIAWIIAGLMIGKFALNKMPLQVSIVAGMVIITSIINLTYIQYQKPKAEKTQENIQVEESKEADPEGTIVVEAGNGTLNTNKYDSMSYIAESARGKEAYLASKDATASYGVEASAAGVYELWIKLSDDAAHDNETRSASIMVNNQQEAIYKHTSEDTKGWKYYKVDNVNLIAGNNKIDFTKIATTSAAFVMDEFKLIPLKSS